MALAPGTRLGVYEVTAQIGKGGMGQVYRATDTKLKRQVAVKVLPPSLAADAQRLARFQREAEVLASLNHPNIAAIYGVEESQGVRALVMELVDGEDLSQRLARGPIVLDEALPIARQIAEALEAAHEQGVIHRDLKPANIKVRPDGTVKVLDFGLAKALERRSSSGEEGREDAVNSPTITSPAMTEAGMILGTAAYMSPEQARGKLVDKRADIWSFGCVLYEMLTGRRAFDGDGVSETLARILEREPDWTRLPATLSPTIRNYLTRCLHKDPRQRIHDIADVRLALEGVFETVPLPPTTAAPPRPRTGRVAPIIAAVALLAAAALAIPALRYLRQTPPPSLPETRVDLVTPATGDQTSFALSPDGAMVVFVGASDGPSRLWLRSLAATTAQPVIGSEGATYPFWSADSRSVGFFAEGKLKRFDIGGRPPEILVPFGSRGGTWNADGVILFATTVGGLFRVPASGGQPVAATTLDRQGSHRYPSFLPDGRHFLFLAGGTPDTSGIYLGSLDSPKTQRLTPSATAGVYLRPGWLLWVRGGSLVAQRLDLEAQTLTGEPVTVADPVAHDPDQGSSAVSVSAAGMVAYRTGRGNRRQLRWFDRSGKALGTLGEPDESPPNSPSVSPDGGRVAVHRLVQGNWDIWLLAGTRASRFTFDAAQDRFPLWSRDGSRIAFDSNRKGRRDLYYKSSAGAGSDELLLESQQDKIALDWSADGRFIIYQSFGPQTSRDLWILPMEGDRRPWEFLKTGFDERWAHFSPDARWVAYQSNESGREEIYVRPFATPVASVTVATGAAGQWQISTAGGVFPRWRPDGRELYYIDPMGHMMAARIAVTGATLTPGAPQTLFATAIVGGGVDGGQGRHYDVSRDGRFLINSVMQDPLAPITLLQHWNPEAKR